MTRRPDARPCIRLGAESHTNVRRKADERHTFALRKADERHTRIRGAADAADQAGRRAA